MAKRRMGLIAVLICFWICLTPCQALAASTTDAKEPISVEKDSVLKISYSYEISVFAALPVRLYKIAEVSADCHYTLTPSFEKSGLMINGTESTGQWNVIRSTLESYILGNGIEADNITETDIEGRASFEDLKPGLYLAITDPINQNESVYVFDSALIALPGLGSDGLWQYQVAVKAKGEMLPPVDGDEEIEYKVTKLWKGDRRNVRPKSIVVEIFRDGISYETVNLSEENRWTYVWKAKKDGADWKIVERKIPSGYTVTVEERDTSFVLTNTYNQKPNTPDTPKTGDTSNIMLWVILMIISGSMLIVLGTTGKRSHE